MQDGPVSASVLPLLGLVMHSWPAALQAVENPPARFGGGGKLLWYPGAAHC